jgi:hypothetical protein
LVAPSRFGSVDPIVEQPAKETAFGDRSGGCPQVEDDPVWAGAAGPRLLVMSQHIDPRTLRRIRFDLLAEDAALGRHTNRVHLPDAGACTAVTAGAVNVLTTAATDLGDDLRATSDALEQVVILALETDRAVAARVSWLTDLLAEQVV